MEHAMDRRPNVLFLKFALATLIAASASAQISLPPAGIIDTVSGNDLPGFSGDGGPALKASFGWLSGISVDATGNLFVVDGSRIRKIASSTGIVTTVANVRGVAGLAVDASGNLFISTEATIKKVTMPDGIITTIAGKDSQPGYSGDGGPAVQAEVNGPSKVAIDLLGYIYFADRANHRIRMIDPNGQISTVAGTGLPGFSGDSGPAASAQLNSPGDVVIDVRGNVFIEDSQNYRIRKVAVESGLITTVAGTGEFGFYGDGGLAIGACFGQLTGIAVDVHGDLYLADYSNNRVREIDAATGIISTVAGTGTAGSRGDKGPAVTAELETIYGIALDHSGYLYILNSGLGVIRAVGPGAAQAPSSYLVTLTSSDPKPRMGQYVTLTATVTSNLGLPALSGTVTWYNGSTQIGTSKVDGTGTATMVTELADAGNVTVTASYSGDLSGYATLTIPVYGYSLSADPKSPLFVNAGQNAQFGISLLGFQGFQGPVNLSCAGLPGPGYCSFSATEVIFSETAASHAVSLVVHTQNAAATATGLMPHSGLLFATLCPLLFFFSRARRANAYLRVFTFMMLAVWLTGAVTGCGGSGSPSTTVAPAGDGNKLAQGSYTFTVDATSGNTIVKLPITMTVE
jgi:sugar lactone lactonase YvrE